MDWIGLDWIGLDWIGLGWIGLDWIGSDRKFTSFEPFIYCLNRCLKKIVAFHLILTFEIGDPANLDNTFQHFDKWVSAY